MAEIMMALRCGGSGAALALVLVACAEAPAGRGPTPVAQDGTPTVARSISERVQIGVDYPFELGTHCGIQGAVFDGRTWRADPPLDDGNHNPPVGWDNPTQVGTMTLQAADRAVFEDAAGHRVAFTPGPPSEPCD